jgi:hypothetical protein
MQLKSLLTRFAAARLQRALTVLSATSTRSRTAGQQYNSTAAHARVAGSCNALLPMQVQQRATDL